MAIVSRHGSNTVGFMVDYSGLTDFLAAGEALAEAGQDKEYIDNNMSAALARANDEFNMEAAAMGATGAIKHMFEWGTAGVNRGRTNMRPNALSEPARLWKFIHEGAGMSRTLTFVYKPSVAYVPNPTARDTGMSQEVIGKLKRHVFHSKAEVMEEGEMVTIAPTEGKKFLLIPAYEERREHFRPHDIKRGYMLHPGPISTTPGAQTAGTFSIFFREFWEGRGGEIVDKAMEKYIYEDFMWDISKSNLHLAKAATPVLAENPVAEVAAKKKRVKKKAQTKARGRRAKNEQ